MAAADEFERVLHVAQEVFVYEIPPRTSTTRAVRAADWDLTNPNWKGRLKIVLKRNRCVIKLESRTGELFALCPVEAHPGVAVEPVSDSSRYFVLRFEDSSGHHAFAGMGFQDRGDAFDFNVALQSHFKGVKRDLQIAMETSNPQPHVDYSLKAGQKITVNLSKKVHDDNNDNILKSNPAPKPLNAGSGILLPPPPTSGNPVQKPEKTTDEFGDFFSGSDSKSVGSNDWVKF